MAKEPNPNSHPYVSKSSYRYDPIRQTLQTEELGAYDTVGLQVSLVEETVLDLVSDVSTDFEEVSHIAELCTDRQVSPKHILDVVRDYLDCESEALVR